MSGHKMFRSPNRNQIVCFFLLLMLTLTIVNRILFNSPDEQATQDISLTGLRQNERTEVYHQHDQPSIYPVFTDVTEFLNKAPDTGNIFTASPAHMLKGMKNPCFALTNKTVNVGNIDAAEAVQRGYEIRCLPYAYLSGFTKCGTTDIFHQMSSHQLIRGGRGKGTHFWDNIYQKENNNIDSYSKLFKSSYIVESFQKYGSMTHGSDQTDDFRDLRFVDGTPRLIWHGDTWDEDVFNDGLMEPDILLPHKLFHVNPHSKIIVSVRNPADRLRSDYDYYVKGKKSPELFHGKVVDAIRWWRNCTEKMANFPKACAYGKAPQGLPELGYEVCMRDKAATRAKRINHERSCQASQAWALNAADRLRVSMYDLYIKEWLKVFPRENFLFVKFEDYSKEPLEYAKKHIFPFLGLPPYDSMIGRESDKSHKVANRSPSKTKMLSETRELLDDFFQMTKESLAELLNDQRFLWKD